MYNFLDKKGLNYFWQLIKAKITKEQVGLGNVENKSSATIRSEITKENVTKALGYTPPKNDTTYSDATTSTAGLMSASDKSKLDSVASGANNYSHPTYTAKSSGLYKLTVDSTGHVSSATAVTKSDITALGIPESDTNTTTTTGASNTSSKIYLVGATSQSSAPTTYSHDTVYVGTDGHLYSNSKQAVNLSDSQALTNKTYNGYTLGAACSKGVDTTATSGSTNLITSGAVYDALSTKTEANIKKNSNATDGDIISTHLTVGTRGTGDIGANSFTSGINNVALGIKSASIAGNNNTISGDNSVVVGGANNAVNKNSSVVLGGNLSTVSAERAAVIGGYSDTASGNNSVVMGGYSNTASSGNSAVVGGYSNTASGDFSVVCGGGWNRTLAYQLKTGHYSKDGIAGTASGTTGDAFIVGNGTSESASNAFRVAYDGNCYAATAMNSTGADYAECFEWADGNPGNEDRIGFMTAFEGDKIRFANENDPVEIIGVVSALPAVVGDNYADEWCGKYLKDKYGRLLTEHKVYEAEYRDVEAYEEIELTAEEISEIQEEITNDETLTDYEKAVKLSELPTTKTVKVTKQELVHEAYEADEYVLNPDYNADEEYIPRLKRKEYSAVGTHGKLAVRDDGSCEVGGFCRSGNGGIATKSDSGFYVMERIDYETVRIYIK